jgi:hypothetical protein
MGHVWPTAEADTLDATALVAKVATTAFRVAAPHNADQIAERASVRSGD